MFRSVCPTCAEPSRFDDTREGREVECPRCRSPFVAKPERRYEDNDEPRNRAPKPDGSGYATLSLVIGLVGIPSSACCGVGAVLGLGGLLAGYAGLQSRFRSLSILGMMLNLAAIVLSIGAVTVFIVTQSAVDRDVPPAPDGTQAPFVANAKN